MKRLYLPMLFMSVCLFAASCTDMNEPIGKVTGMKPVYVPKANAFDIYSESPKAIINPGKIYQSGSYIYVVERGQGVHVVDNSDPGSPTKVSFIHIAGINDVAVKGKYLYADNITDLVAIDLSDPVEVTVSKRLKDQYRLDQMFYPASYNGYFECADTSKGYVVGWVETELNDPRCYR